MVLDCNTVAWLIKINHIVSFEIRNLPVPILTDDFNSDLTQPRTLTIIKTRRCLFNSAYPVPSNIQLTRLSCNLRHKPGLNLKRRIASENEYPVRFPC